MSDDLDTLPVNKAEQFDPAESARVKPYLVSTNKKGIFNSDLKKALILIAVFMVLSIPFSIGNRLITWVIKVAVFAIIAILICKFLN